MKKILLLIGVMAFGVFSVVRGDLLGKIQNIDTLVQQGKYITAEAQARRLLNDPNITPQERASVQNLLNEISRKKSESSQSAQDPIGNIIATEQGESAEGELFEEESTEEKVLTTKEDVSDGSKFEAYDNYERAALATKNPDTIFKMAQLYFRDGLYERAVNVSKKDSKGDVRNLYVVAIGSRLMGQYDQSIDYYNRILLKYPNQSEARLGRGIAYKSKGEFQKALDDLRTVNGNAEVNRAISELNSILSSK